MKILAVLVMFLVPVMGWAQGTSYPQANVSFGDFKELVAEVETHRASRLIEFDTCLAMGQEPGVVTLDALEESN